MIITVSKTRRLKSYTYGWMIERLQERKSKDGTVSTVWVEDRPAYPANLARGLEMCLEREFIDGGDCTIAEVPGRLKTALNALRTTLEKARAAA